MKQCASIHLRDQKLYIRTSSRTKNGIWIDTGPVQVIDVDDASAITEATRAALQNSRHGLPTPPASEDLTGAILEAANVKSWRTFVSRAKVVDICSSAGLATITPFKKVAARGNYEPQTEKSRACRVASADLGATILDAFNDAT